MKYAVIRTDTADAGIRKIILYIAQNFGNTAALEKLGEIEKRILELGDDPYIGTEPRYLILKRQGYKVLILEKDLVFYKIHLIFLILYLFLRSYFWLLLVFLLFHHTIL